MKKKKFLFRRKLVKTSTITMALLIAATLISSSAVSVTIGNEQETVIKVKVNENPQPLIVPTMETKIDFMSALAWNSNEQQSANGNRAIEVIYDNGMDYVGLAASQFDTVYDLDPVCADDFILTDAGNLTIEYVLWLGGYWNGDPGAFDWNVTIYEDDGSGYHPGNVIDTNVFANADTHESLVYSSGTSHYFEYWVELPTPLTVTVDTKYWVSCQGVGDFPPQSGFGRHTTILNHQGNFKSVYFGFPNWVNASDVFGDPYDFAFQLGKYVPIQDDLELVSINSPVSGDAGIITPEVTVKNNADAQTNVPVQMTIGKITGVTVVPYYTEDFEADNGGYAVTGGLWEWGTPTYGPSGAYSGSYCWGTDLDYYYINMANAMLDSVPITIPVGATLNFWSWFYCENYYDGGNVKISTDGGSTFTILGSYLDPYNEDAAYSGNAGIPGEPCFSGSGQNFWQERTFDLGAYVGETAIIRWHFGSDSSVYSYPGWYVDDVSITYEVYTVDVEFDKTVYIDIGEGATEDVTFSDWMPNDWQVSENTDVDYFVHAETQLPGDEVPDNDAKDGAFTLSYPYLHDIAVMSINDPDSGDAQTLPVEVILKNVGQNPECCYLSNVQIASMVFTSAWTSVIYSGTGEWIQMPYSAPGYTPPLGTGLYFAGCDSDMYGSLVYDCGLFTYALDLTGQTSVALDFEMSFVHYINDWGEVNTYSGGMDPGDFEENLATYTVSTYAVHETLTFDPSGYADPSEVYIEFYYTTAGYTWEYIFKIDDVVVTPGGLSEGFEGGVFPPGGGFVLTTEYDEDISLITLDPGEEATLTYPDWTPDALALGVNGDIDYQIIAEQNLPGDTNSANDILTKDINLDYRHDVGIKEITSPADGKAFDWLGYNDGHTENAYKWNDQSPWTIAIELSDPELAPYRTYELTEVYFSCGCDDYGFYAEDYEVYYATGSLPDISTLTPIATGTASDTGWTTASVPAQPMPATGSAFVIVSYVTSVGFPAGFDYDNGDIRGQHMLQTLTTNDWIHLQDLWGSPAVWGLDAGLTPGGGPPGVDIYVDAGPQDIGAIVENLGTFGETGLTCYAEIYEYITNETVGTLDWEANVTGINLDPLGGEETLAFGSYDFADEGVYELILNLPLGNDVDEGNNEEILGIGVDDTAPTSDHTVDPATPDGENGWYVSDVTVSFTATDALSGVDHIEYKVNGGSVQTGDSVTLTTDGTHDVEYRAVDNVGNTESWNSVDPINIDQTAPDVDLIWESPDNKNVDFTADCSDPTSGMDYVEFYLNDGLTFTDDSEPFEWSILWSPSLKTAVFKSIAYDMAGNNAFDTETDIRAFPVPHSTPTPSVRQTNPL